jgi:hypothetical protein
MRCVRLGRSESTIVAAAAVLAKIGLIEPAAGEAGAGISSAQATGLQRG